MSSPLHNALATVLIGVICAAFSTGPALGQAPAEDRRPGSNPLSDAQQRAEFARQAGEKAGSRAKQSQLTLQQIEQEMQAAQKELEALRARQAKTRKELAAAQAEQAAALKSLEREAAELERLRRSQK